MIILLKILKRIKNLKEKLKIDEKGTFYGFSIGKQQEFIEYDEKNAKTICKYYVKKQKFYLNTKHKELINKWSFKYYRSLNMFLRSLIRVPKKKEEEFKDFSDKLSKLIESSKGLEDNVILFRGEIDVDLNRFKLNQINQFMGFASTSFSKKVALKFTKSLNNDSNYLIVIKAKKKTKGIAIDGGYLGNILTNMSGY
ncbi:MAG: hypothetical protein IK044_02370 [Methanobrevibacter sp.]|nr:hypothetical protein [Methanobrevibacter sp.]